MWRETRTYLNYDAGHADAGTRESVTIKDLVDVAVEAETEEVGVDDRVAAQNHGPGPDEAAAKKCRNVGLLDMTWVITLRHGIHLD